jgi:TAG lipase/lysophosphatidylethanolamine acyltransferase
LILGNDIWRQTPTSKYYDYRLIYERLEAIISAWENADIATLVNLLRSGLVRNLGNITAPRLFNRAYAGTKLLIEDYITQIALTIERVASLPTSSSHENGLTSQAKLDLLHDTRQAFGRSTLVLQGGAIFGLCHLGVVKALHLRGLLPRIIVGTATGALIAALVGIHTEEELLGFLTGDGIDLSAFTSTGGSADNKGGFFRNSSWVSTLVRRVRRFLREGYFLDVSVLESCVRANVGDLTFAEAYNHTKRVLNITVSTDSHSGVPNLLNYLTAPNVLIWSAAVASNATSPGNFYHPVTLQCKDPDTGEIGPLASAEEVKFNSWISTTYTDRDSPLARVAELFNVNHFIVSQARPYLVPFLRSDLQTPNQHLRSPGTLGLTSSFRRLVTMELHHRLSQADSLGLLPLAIRRFLIDETIPGASLTLVPQLTFTDFGRLLENPTKNAVEYWVTRGERSVWPAVSALKVRSAIEVSLDRMYQRVRRRRPSTDGDVPVSRKRIRADSAGVR